MNQVEVIVALRKCPFCGEKVNVLTGLTHETLEGNAYAIQCRNMGCIMPRTSTYMDLLDLVRAFNTRKKNALIDKSEFFETTVRVRWSK